MLFNSNCIKNEQTVLAYNAMHPIALLTISYQVFKAALASPVQNLRTE
jgi:hypothetical protein